MGVEVTDLWARVPMWLLADGGVRSLPAPARVALYDLAMNGGSACCGDDPSAALDGLCAGAGEHLGVMLRRRVVVVDHGRLMLGGPTGAAVHPAPEASAAAPSAAGSPKPDERAAANRLGALWSKAACKGVDARVAWVDSPAGVAFLAREGLPREWAVARANHNGKVGANHANHAANPTPTMPTVGSQPDANPTPTAPLPPTPPLSENNEEERENQTRANNANHTPTQPANSANQPTPTSPTTPTPSAHGPATTATGRSLLDAFRDATGSRATLVGNMAEERGLADMLARLAPTAAEVTAMGAALGEVAAWWPPGKRGAPKHVTLRDLAGFRGADGSPEWGPLSALVAHVRAKAKPVDRKAALAAALLSADPWVSAAARAGHLLHEEEA